MSRLPFTGHFKFLVGYLPFCGMVSLLVVVCIYMVHDVHAAMTCTARTGSSLVRAVYTDGTWCGVEGKGEVEEETVIATAEWDDSIPTTGWGKLKVTAVVDPKVPETPESAERRAYGAGYAEGIATQERIWQMLSNVDDNDLRFELRDFFSKHLDHLKKSIRDNPKDTFWIHVHFMLFQMEGVLAGYLSVCPPEEQIDILDVMRLNMDGDRFDLEDAIKRGYIKSSPDSATEKLAEVQVSLSSERSGAAQKASAAAVKRLDKSVSSLMKLRQEEEKLLWNKMLSSKGNHKNIISVRSNKQPFSAGTHLAQDSRFEMHHAKVMKDEENVWRELVRKGHCTAIIKLLDDHQDILIAHTTWEGYSEMLRIYKHYEIELPGAVATKISFSSYPGMISSTDDWYITSAHLAIIETTTEIVDKKILHHLGPDVGVVSWIRSMVASRLADNGRTWVEVYGSQNSGTYNCQWMVIDYNLFHPGVDPLPPGTFYLLESIPNVVHYEDMTEFLDKHEVFPSANRPMFEEVRIPAGYPRDRVGDSLDFFSFGKNPRHNIILRDAEKVQNIDDMKKLIRKNDYKNDPYSNGHPDEAIAARYDLAGMGNPSGAVDGKVTGYAGVRSLSCSIIAGPTTENGLPPFDFSSQSSLEGGSHIGLPDRWDFDWIEMKFE